MLEEEKLTKIRLMYEVLLQWSSFGYACILTFLVALDVGSTIMTLSLSSEFVELNPLVNFLGFPASIFLVAFTCFEILRETYNMEWFGGKKKLCNLILLIGIIERSVVVLLNFMQIAIYLLR